MAADDEPGTRVLIVDDYPDVCEVLSAELQSRGFSVAAANNFEDARQRLLADPFDILVTDVRLGAFNGIQLAVIARAHWPKIAIVVMSGFDDPVLKAEATALNAAYLLKPVMPEHLVTTLRSLSEPEV